MWLPTGRIPTCSTVRSMTYRTTVTSRVCPSRRARPIACSSTDGFHCGSTMWMRFAAVRFNLSMTQLANNYHSYTRLAYPTASVPKNHQQYGDVGIILVWTENLSCWWFRSVSGISNVLVQQEKTILLMPISLRSTVMCLQLTSLSHERCY